VAERTARATHEPAGVAAKGGPTLAVVTRPLDAKVTATCTVPCWPVAHAETALRTRPIAAMMSPRAGVSASPPDVRGAGSALLLPPPPEAQRKMHGMSPRQLRTHGLTVGVVGVGGAVTCGAGSLLVRVDAVEALDLERARPPPSDARLVGVFVAGALPGAGACCAGCGSGVEGCASTVGVVLGDDDRSPLIVVVAAGAVRMIMAAPSPPPTRMIDAPRTLTITVLLLFAGFSLGSAASVGAATGASTGPASGEASPPPSPRIAPSDEPPVASALMSMMLESEWAFCSCFSSPPESCASEKSAEFSLRAPVPFDPLLLFDSLLEALALEKKSPLDAGGAAAVFDADGTGLRAAVSRTSLVVPNRGVSVSAGFDMNVTRCPRWLREDPTSRANHRW
jgi:hypothetical protein